MTSASNITKEVNKEFETLLKNLGKSNLNLDHFKYQCLDHIKHGQMEKIKSLYQLFEALYERDVIDPNDLSFLHGVFVVLDKEDLVGMLRHYQEKVESLNNTGNIQSVDSDSGASKKIKTVVHSPESQIDNLAQPFGDNQDISRAVYHVGSKITSNWQSLARFLEIPDEIIEENLHNHPRDIRGAIHSTLNWWERHGNNVRKETLISSLRQIRRNDLADDLQYNLF